MREIQVTELKQRAANYHVQDLHSKKQLGFIQKDIVENEFVFKSDFQTVLTMSQTEQLLRHLNILNKI